MQQLLQHQLKLRSNGFQKALILNLPDWQLEGTNFGGTWCIVVEEDDEVADCETKTFPLTMVSTDYG